MFLYLKTVETLMEYCIMQHFIRVLVKVPVYRHPKWNVKNTRRQCNMHESWGSDRGFRPPPWKNHKKTIGFLNNTGQDSPKTKTAFNVGSSSASQRNAIFMTFCWRANNGSLLVAFWASFPSPLINLKKRCRVRPPLPKLSESAHVQCILCLTLCMMDKFACLYHVCWFFFKADFFKKNPEKYF